MATTGTDNRETCLKEKDIAGNARSTEGEDVFEPALVAKVADEQVIGSSENSSQIAQGEIFEPDLAQGLKVTEPNKATLSEEELGLGHPISGESEKTSDENEETARELEIPLSSSEVEESRKSEDHEHIHLNETIQKNPEAEEKEYKDEEPSEVEQKQSLGGRLKGTWNNLWSSESSKKDVDDVSHSKEKEILRDESLEAATTKIGSETILNEEAEKSDNQEVSSSEVVFLPHDKDREYSIEEKSQEPDGKNHDPEEIIETVISSDYKHIQSDSVSGTIGLEIDEPKHVDSYEIEGNNTNEEQVTDSFEDVRRNRTEEATEYHEDQVEVEEKEISDQLADDHVSEHVNDGSSGAVSGSDISVQKDSDVQLVQPVHEIQFSDSRSVENEKPVETGAESTLDFEEKSETDAENNTEYKLQRQDEASGEHDHETPDAIEKTIQKESEAKETSEVEQKQSVKEMIKGKWNNYWSPESAKDVDELSVSHSSEKEILQEEVGHVESDKSENVLESEVPDEINESGRKDGSLEEATTKIGSETILNEEAEKSDNQSEVSRDQKGTDEDGAVKGIREDSTADNLLNRGLGEATFIEEKNTDHEEMKSGADMQGAETTAAIENADSKAENPSDQNEEASRELELPLTVTPVEETREYKVGSDNTYSEATRSGDETNREGVFDENQVPIKEPKDLHDVHETNSKELAEGASETDLTPTSEMESDKPETESTLNFEEKSQTGAENKEEYKLQRQDEASGEPDHDHDHETPDAIEKTIHGNEVEAEEKESEAKETSEVEQKQSVKEMLKGKWNNYWSPESSKDVDELAVPHSTEKEILQEEAGKEYTEASPVESETRVLYSEVPDEINESGIKKESLEAATTKIGSETILNEEDSSVVDIPGAGGVENVVSESEHGRGLHISNTDSEINEKSSTAGVTNKEVVVAADGNTIESLTDHENPDITLVETTYEEKEATERGEDKELETVISRDEKHIQSDSVSATIGHDIDEPKHEDSSEAEGNNTNEEQVQKDSEEATEPKISSEEKDTVFEPVLTTETVTREIEELIPANVSESVGEAEQRVSTDPKTSMSDHDVPHMEAEASSEIFQAGEEISRYAEESSEVTKSEDDEIKEATEKSLSTEEANASASVSETLEITEHQVKEDIPIAVPDREISERGDSEESKETVIPSEDKHIQSDSVTRSVGFEIDELKHVDSSEAAGSNKNEEETSEVQLEQSVHETLTDEQSLSSEISKKDVDELAVSLSTEKEILQEEVGKEYTESSAVESEKSENILESEVPDKINESGTKDEPLEAATTKIGSETILNEEAEKSDNQSEVSRDQEVSSSEVVFLPHDKDREYSIEEKSQEPDGKNPEQGDPEEIIETVISNDYKHTQSDSVSGTVGLEIDEPKHVDSYETEGNNTNEDQARVVIRESEGEDKDIHYPASPKELSTETRHIDDPLDLTEPSEELNQASHAAKETEMPEEPQPSESTEVGIRSVGEDAELLQKYPAVGNVQNEIQKLENLNPASEAAEVEAEEKEISDQLADDHVSEHVNDSSFGAVSGSDISVQKDSEVAIEPVISDEEKVTFFEPVSTTETVTREIEELIPANVSGAVGETDPKTSMSDHDVPHMEAAATPDIFQVGEEVPRCAEESSEVRKSEDGETVTNEKSLSTEEANASASATETLGITEHLTETSKDIAGNEELRTENVQRDEDRELQTGGAKGEDEEIEVQRGENSCSEVPLAVDPVEDTSNKIIGEVEIKEDITSAVPDREISERGYPEDKHIQSNSVTGTVGLEIDEPKHVDPSESAESYKKEEGKENNQDQAIDSSDAAGSNEGEEIKEKIDEDQATVETRGSETKRDEADTRVLEGEDLKVHAHEFKLESLSPPEESSTIIRDMDEQGNISESSQIPESAQSVESFESALSDLSYGSAEETIQKTEDTDLQPLSDPLEVDPRVTIDLKNSISDKDVRQVEEEADTEIFQATEDSEESKGEEEQMITDEIKEATGKSPPTEAAYTSASASASETTLEIASPEIAKHESEGTKEIATEEELQIEIAERDEKESKTEEARVEEEEGEVQRGENSYSDVPFMVARDSGDGTSNKIIGEEEIKEYSPRVIPDQKISEEGDPEESTETVISGEDKHIQSDSVTETRGLEMGELKHVDSSEEAAGSNNNEDQATNSSEDAENNENENQTETKQDETDIRSSITEGEDLLKTHVSDVKLESLSPPEKSSTRSYNIDDLAKPTEISPEIASLSMKETGIPKEPPSSESGEVTVTRDLEDRVDEDVHLLQKVQPVTTVPDEIKKLRTGNVPNAASEAATNEYAEKAEDKEVKTDEEEEVKAQRLESLSSEVPSTVEKDPEAEMNEKSSSAILEKKIPTQGQLIQTVSSNEDIGIQSIPVTRAIKLENEELKHVNASEAAAGTESVEFEDEKSTPRDYKEIPQTEDKETQEPESLHVPDGEKGIEITRDKQDAEAATPLADTKKTTELENSEYVTQVQQQATSREYQAGGENSNDEQISPEQVKSKEEKRVTSETKEATGKSVQETMEVAEQFNEPEKENLEVKIVESDELETVKSDVQEEGDNSGSEAPVIVEHSKDIEAKGSPKKHNGILSGVGSKVKHSIAKVKKVITGKHSHSKPH